MHLFLSCVLTVNVVVVVLVVCFTNFFSAGYAYVKTHNVQIKSFS
jgi:hypothetical protein